MTTLTDAVRYAIIQELTNVHTALPAQIVQYDYTKQKAQVQPVLSKRYTNGEVQELPLINNVPVIFPRAGGGSLTFPVVEGDTCLLVFIERSTDIWKSRGGIVAPTDPRKFDLSDPVAIMGLFPFTEDSFAENNEDVVLTFKGSKVVIKQDGSIQLNTSNTVAIGNSTVELLEVLSQTLNLLATSITTAPASPFAFAPQWQALKLQLDQIKGSIS